MLDAVIVGLGRWGRKLVDSVQTGGVPEGAAIRFTLAQFGLVEFEGQLPIVLASDLCDPFALTFEQFGHAALLGIGPFREALFGLLRDVGRTAFQMRQQVADIFLR